MPAKVILSPYERISHSRTRGAIAKIASVFTAWPRTLLPFTRRRADCCRGKPFDTLGEPIFP